MLPKIEDLKGISSAVIIGVAALFLSAYTPSYLNSILIALIIGIILNNLVAIPKDVESTVNESTRTLLS
jgi:uncharacterized membrane protein YadS